MEFSSTQTDKEQHRRKTRNSSHNVFADNRQGNISIRAISYRKDFSIATDFLGGIKSSGAGVTDEAG